MKRIAMLLALLPLLGMHGQFTVPFAARPVVAVAPTITYVAAASTSSYGGSTICTLHPTFTSGQLAIVVINDGYQSVNISTATLTVSDGTNTYTQISSFPYLDASTHSKTSAWWTKPATGTPTINVSASVSLGQLNCAVVGYTSSSGWKAAPVDQVAPVDLTTGTSLASYICPTTFAMSSGTTGTTSQATELELGIFSGVTSSGTATFTIAGTSGFTMRKSYASAGAFVGVVDTTSSSAGTFTATANWCAVTGSTGTTTGGSGSIVTLMPN